MGAFGELLIQRWGGNIESYNGNKTLKKDKIQTEEASKEEIIFDINLCRAKRKLKSLTNSLIYRQEEAFLYTEEVIKNGFYQLGFNEYIQNEMWKEFSLFLDKYC